MHARSAYARDSRFPGAPVCDPLNELFLKDAKRTQLTNTRPVRRMELNFPQYSLHATFQCVRVQNWSESGAVLDIILVACENYRRPPSVALFREVEKEQRTVFRLYVT